jgi:hypothetical protein
MTRDDMIQALIHSDWEMLSEKDLFALFQEWSESNMRDLPDVEIKELYDERFED